DVHETYAYLTGELQKLNIAYIHISNNPGIHPKTHQAIRANFSNALIYCNGLTPETAEQELQDGPADLVAFGRSFLANPDFMRRMGKNAPTPVDYTTSEHYPFPDNRYNLLRPVKKGSYNPPHLK